MQIIRIMRDGWNTLDNMNMNIYLFVSMIYKASAEMLFVYPNEYSRCLNDTAAKTVSIWIKKKTRENKSSFCIFYYTWYKVYIFPICFYVSIFISIGVRLANSSFFLLLFIRFIPCNGIIQLFSVLCAHFIESWESFVDSKWNELLIKMDVAF